MVSHVVTLILDEKDAGSINGSPPPWDGNVALSLADRDCRHLAISDADAKM